MNVLLPKELRIIEVIYALVASNSDSAKLKKKMRPFLRLTAFLFILTFSIRDKAFGQTAAISSQENNFVKLYSKLASFIQTDYDSISVYSDNFEKEFTSFIKNNPTTLDYPFKKLVDSNFCDVSTSSDGNFRIYSWDTWTGGTMHIFQEIFQWKDKGKVYTKVPNNGDVEGFFCSKIFTVDINNKRYYLAVTNGIYSTKDGVQSISAYTIENGKLVDTVKLFKTKTKKLNSIDVEFDFFSVVDRTERPFELITYDDKQKIIYVPVVGDKGRVTKKNILYQLKGSYFEFIGIETGMRK